MLQFPSDIIARCVGSGRKMGLAIVTDFFSTVFILVLDREINFGFNFDAPVLECSHSSLYAVVTIDSFRHATLQVQRNINNIELFNADLTSMLCDENENVHCCNQ